MIFIQGVPPRRRDQKAAIRRGLASITRILLHGQWRWPGPALRRLRRWVRVVHALEARLQLTVPATAGLPQALAALDALEAGDRSCAAEACALLLHHRKSLLHRLDALAAAAPQRPASLVLTEAILLPRAPIQAAPPGPSSRPRHPHGRTRCAPPGIRTHTAMRAGR